MKKFISFILIVWQQLPTNFNSWRFHFCYKYVRSILHNLSDTEEKNLMFLWNAKLGSKFFSSDLPIVLNQFINISCVKLSCCCHKLSTLLFMAQITSSCLPSLHFLASAPINSHHHKQPGFGDEFQMERLLRQSKIQLWCVV